MKRCLLLLLCFFSLASALTTEDVFSQCQQRTTEEKVLCFSQKFLGQPYLANPLGEGPHATFTRQPRLRLDGFDCQTLVETVLALSRAENASEVGLWMDNIRYHKAQPSFTARRHFTDSEWVPGLESLKLLKPWVTEDMRIRRVFCNRRAWYRKLTLDRIHREDLTLPKRSAAATPSRARQRGKKYLETLRYFPSERLIKKPSLLSSYQQGVAVVLFLRDIPKIRTTIGTDLNVVHMGLLLQNQQGWILRHASSVEKKVVDRNFFDYLQEQSKKPGF